MKSASLFAACIGLVLAGPFAAGEEVEQESVQIEQGRGSDPAVDYARLVQFGPWDDRNYQLTRKDIALLSPGEAKLRIPIPAFFRVELRREFPNLPVEGPSQYPRAAVPLFRARYGSLLQNGVEKEVLEEGERGQRVSVPAGANIQLNQLLTRDEVTIEINPLFHDRVIAGSNSPTGQEMFYSSDGGATWTVAGILPNTCCDPTVGWSSDGLTAYAASLGSFPSLSLNFYTSSNFGQTWSSPLLIRGSGTDKEWLHADISSSSPFQDNVYVTWHESNIMQFARSSNRGQSFTVTSFSTAPQGIGSDITTDSAGNIYYCYAALDTRQIILLKSITGGVSFQTPKVIAATNASFDYPIPAMETRNAWTYASCDADRTSGPFAGSVYVAWTDTTAADNDSTPSANHTQIKVARSRDGGASWEISIPHAVDDVQTVDRFNQWLTVDNVGNVHVVFYDTRNSNSRSGVDLYYTFSVDGGESWNDPTRISSETSTNLSDGQEWGDYNGISVMDDQVLPVWTDNRPGDSGGNNKNVFTADVVNVAAETGFLLQCSQPTASVCRPGNAQFVLQALAVAGFEHPITLSLSGLPSGVTANFSSNPIDPGESTTLSLSASSAASAGAYAITVTGSATGVDSREFPLLLNLSTAAPAAPGELQPPDGAEAGHPTVALSWQPVSLASQYRVQVSTSQAFTTTILSTTAEATGVNVSNLTLGQTYYWRVASIGPCGQGVFSAVRSFDASARDFSSANVPKTIPDNSAGGVVSTLTVPDDFTITDVDVVLSLTHTWDEDLDVTLIAPSGASVLLFSGVGSSGDNFTNTELDDEAAASIASGLAPFTGSFKPASALNILDGSTAQGTWQLKVADRFPADTGTLTSWGLAIAGYEKFNGDEVWVQFSFSGLELGTLSRPFNTLSEAVTAATAGGTIKINAGASPEIATINKFVVLSAVGGTVRLGDS